MAASVGHATRQAPLPEVMQGRWVAADDPSSELIIEGGEITCYGARVEYDYKEISTVDDVPVVNLKVLDPAREDDFQRANIVGLAFPPGGILHVWNVKSGDEFVRPGQVLEQE